MTKEEAIEVLEQRMCCRECVADCTCKECEEAFEMAIKALEQEPILEKIRAEIEHEKIGYPPSADYYKAIMKALRIIDKYKAENEVQK